MLRVTSSLSVMRETARALRSFPRKRESRTPTPSLPRLRGREGRGRSDWVPVSAGTNGMGSSSTSPPLRQHILELRLNMLLELRARAHHLREGIALAPWDAGIDDEARIARVGRRVAHGI